MEVADSGMMSLEPLFQHQDNPHHFAEIRWMNLLVLPLEFKNIAPPEYAAFGKLFQTVIHQFP